MENVIHQFKIRSIVGLSIMQLPSFELQTARKKAASMAPLCERLKTQFSTRDMFFWPLGMTMTPTALTLPAGFAFQIQDPDPKKLNFRAGA